MNLFLTAFWVCSTLTTLAVLAYIFWLLRTAGRDAIIDPKLVERFHQNAPYERLAKILNRPSDQEPNDTDKRFCSEPTTLLVTRE
ncbi:hypothetical protein [Aliiroseovarius crassostreae]|uniref:hypothetical protein n=1 Tax=Aliiroseovarius crassostreae TaxID=154981 RepID=UPI00220D1718|nr:hypothetical protein [Aliiroseovarius crassostreae]UWP97800.1 hypothetical protein K3X53_10470 [Aliiroseovarius crassostreae]